jgi:hypothetical protein
VRGKVTLKPIVEVQNRFQLPRCTSASSLSCVERCIVPLQPAGFFDLHGGPVRLHGLDIVAPVPEEDQGEDSRA